MAHVDMANGRSNASATARPAAAAAAIPPPTPPRIHSRTFTVDPHAPPHRLEEQLQEAARLIRDDQLVAFPTETVYGLGGNALSSRALSGIYVAKGRPSDNPLIVHVHCRQQFLSLGRDVPALALTLADRFWPGPLTLIVPTARGDGAASDIARAGLDSVGVRMPSHPVALALLRACGLPLAAPSANLSGRPSPTTAAHVACDLGGRIAGIIDGGPAATTEGDEGIGVESTVVECTEPSAEEKTRGSKGIVTILRPGGITREMLEEVAGVGNVRLDPALQSANAASRLHLHPSASTNPTAVQPLPKQTRRRSNELTTPDTLLNSSSSSSSASAAAVSSSPTPIPSIPPVCSPPLSSSNTTISAPRAPGMKYTHYAPRAPLLVVDGSIDLLLSTALPHLQRGDVVGIMATSESLEAIDAWRKQHDFKEDELIVLPCGRRSDLSSVARSLYGVLRAFDETCVQIIFSEHFPSHGVGEAVMNRLTKAAAGVVRESLQTDDAQAQKQPQK